MSVETKLLCACALGNISSVKLLTEVIKCDPSIVWGIDHGETPLHVACENGNTDIVKYLISTHNCDPQDHCAMGVLLYPGLSPLYTACQNGHLDLARYLISECSCNPNCLKMNGETLLHTACLNGHLNIVKYLITECKCNPQWSTKVGTTPLHLACFSGHIDVARYLITECNCNPQCPDKNGATPLYTACFNGHIGIARCLITECNFNPQCSTNDGVTPLHAACQEGHLGIARYLITECNCNPQCRRNDGDTPLHLACVCGHLDVAKYLVIECNCNPQCSGNDGDTPLHLACERGHLDVARYLISECDCNPQCPKNDGFTPLHAACFNGHIDTARYLITDCNCNPQCPNNIGGTPLHSACFNGHLDMARYLITECNCNPQCSRNDGATPLHLASLNGHLDVARYLITVCNCNPQCSRNCGTPLYVACQEGQLDMARYLITECNCNPQCTKNDGAIPVHTACFNGHLDLARYLITECNCNPQCPNRNGATPLHLACQEGHLDIARYLITECNCNPQCPKNNGYTPLHSACFNGHIDIARYLVTQCNCNPQCPKNDGDTPLHLACENSQLDMARYLITECNCNPQCRNNDGDTPLHVACLKGHEGIVQYLLSTGLCNPLQSNKFGFSALSIAKTEAPKIAQMIKSYYDCLIRYPIESYTKIFTVGDVCVGKSTLVKSLQQNPGLFSSFFGQIFEQRVTGVSAATAGIESFAINSKGFGNVVVYDFAGDYEYYTSQAAFLQSFTSQMAGLFLIVINCKQTKDKVIESLKYWISFIQECWGHNMKDSETNAHIIVVGSHADKVGNIDISCKYAAFEEVLSLPFCGIKCCGTVCLDCRKPSSPQLGHLHSLLDTACTTLRNESVKMDRRCYVLYEHLQTNYGRRGFPACTLKSLSHILRLEDHPLLPHTPNELLPFLKVLHDKGQTILLENKKEDETWVIFQQAILLQKTVGKIFAPPGFKEYVNFSSTGIISHSTVEKIFPHLNSDLVIGFMKHFEFCHAVDNPNTLIDQCRTGGRCYFFPALIRLERPIILWEDSKIKQLSHHCGWYIKCLKAPGKPQFFNSRFLHVLLLRLAFQFALPPDASEHSSDLALKQRCTMWKNGILWSSRKGATIHCELTQHSQTVILLIGCLKECEMEYVKLRSQIIQTILRAKDDMCPLTSVKEGMFADPIKLMKYVNQPHFLLEKMDTYSLTEISTAISQSEPTVIGYRSTTNVQLSVLLYFESYAALSEDRELIKALFVDNKEQEAMSDELVFDHEEVVTEEFLVRVAKCACTCHKYFKVVLKLSKIAEVTETDSEFRKCLQMLRLWRAAHGSNATYKNFRQTLDSYSIFGGRNPLVSSHVSI